MKISTGKLFWAAIIAGALVFNLLLLRFSPRSWETGGASTYHTGPRGLGALYQTLEKSGYRVARKKTSFRIAPPADAVLVILAPSKGIEFEETDALREWIMAGGRVILGVDKSTMDSLLGFTFEPDTIFTRSMKDEELEQNKVRKPLIARSLAGIAHGVARLEPPPANFITSSPAGSIPHLNAGRQTILAERRAGKGAVFAISCADTLMNRNLAKADNLRLFLNIAHAAGSKRLLLFDEYHHNYQGTEWTGTWGFMRLLVVTPYGLCTLLAFTGIILWLLNRDALAVRRPKPHIEMPSSLDHIAAVAGLYSRLRAAPYAGRRIMARLHRELAHKLGRTTDAPLGLLLDEYARLRPGADPKLANTVIAYARRLDSGAETQPEETLRAAQAAETIRKELRS